MKECYFFFGDLSAFQMRENSIVEHKDRGFSSGRGRPAGLEVRKSAGEYRANHATKMHNLKR
jgi:hypothetical protein